MKQEEIRRARRTNNMAHEPLQTARMVAVKPLGDLLSVAELKTDTTSGYAEDAERR